MGAAEPLAISTDNPARPVGVSAPVSRWTRLRAALTPLNLLMGLFCLAYAFFFWRSVAPYWFHPHWTTDDSLQQVYPFHKVFHPEIFAGDLITEMMECYLAPLHYAIMYGMTWVTGEPIMASHWVMLFQVMLSVGFLFFAVRAVSSTVPALFAVVWLLHTRHIMQRLTAGLPRGWGAPIFCAFLYFLFTRNHRGVLLTILAGCLLHPPATLLVAACYGLFLLWGVARRSTRSEFRKPFLVYLALSPLFALLTLSVTRMPEHIGTMASYEQAAQMPEFQEPKGRFPFTPLKPAWSEIRTFGFQAFIGRFYSPGRFWRANMPFVVMGALGMLLLIGWLRRRRVIDAEMVCFLLATGLVYAASRMLAFHLYVPNRHLQFPMGIFFIVVFTVAAWRAFHRGEAGGENAGQRFAATTLRLAWPATLALLVVGALVYAGSGTGLYGAANFNHSITKRGGIWLWVRSNTPEGALFAGHPTFIDPIQLYGVRRAFVTTETSHPFYDRYYAEMKRRLEISLRAFYAPDLRSLVETLEPEGIDFFIFERRQFYPEALSTATYFPPLDTLVRELTNGPVEAYAYRMLPREVNLERYPFMPYRDDQAVVVDVARLREYLQRRGDL